MADLTTSPAGIWVLQALLGIETMPTALRLRPFIPSIDSGPTVATMVGERPLTQTAEYASLVAAGVIDPDGRVDDGVRDWMTVVGRPDREVVVAIRRPAGDSDGTIQERTLSVCRRDRWLAMIARCARVEPNGSCGDEVVLGPVGETASPDEQVALICDTVLYAFGDAEPAAIDGVNLPTAALRAAIDATQRSPDFPARGDDSWAVATALARLGLSPDQVAAIVAGLRVDESAMAVVSVIDHGVTRTVHQEVLGVYDTDCGRFTLTNTTAPDGSSWTSIWPTTPGALRQDLTRLLSVPRAGGQCA